MTFELNDDEAGRGGSNSKPIIYHLINVLYSGNLLHSTHCARRHEPNILRRYLRESHNFLIWCNSHKLNNTIRQHSPDRQTMLSHSIPMDLYRFVRNSWASKNVEVRDMRCPTTATTMGISIFAEAHFPFLARTRCKPQFRRLLFNQFVGQSSGIASVYKNMRLQDTLECIKSDFSNK